MKDRDRVFMLVLPIVFVSLGVTTWVVGNIMGDRTGGSNLATQLVTLAAAAWQKEKNEGGTTVRAEKVDNVNS